MGDNGTARISSLFSAEEVLCGLPSVTRDEVIRRLAERLKKAGRIADMDAAVASVLAREALGATVVAPGLAAPHARVPNQPNIALAVATSPEGIAFDPKSSDRMNLVVMIITDEKAPGAHLQALAALGRAFADPATVQKVARLGSADQVWQFFDRGAGVLPEFVTAAEVMSTDFPTLRTTDTLAMAIDCFCRTRVPRIAVVDDDGDFAGVVGEREILRLSMPEYILWLDDLAPILQFEPFAETLKSEHITRVAEIMSTDIVSVTETTHASMWFTRWSSARTTRLSPSIKVVRRHLNC